jgi:hypothetical protein
VQLFLTGTLYFLPKALIDIKWGCYYFFRLLLATCVRDQGPDSVFTSSFPLNIILIIRIVAFIGVGAANSTFLQLSRYKLKSALNLWRSHHSFIFTLVGEQNIVAKTQNNLQTAALRNLSK